MSPVPSSDLDALLVRFEPPIADLTRRLVAMLHEIGPALTAAVKFGWGSVNFRHPRAGHLMALFPQQDNVLLIFEHGRLLDSPLLTDNGKVTQVRWIPFSADDLIPVDDIAILLSEAIALRS
jgi:hypothetical protein